MIEQLLGLEGLSDEERRRFRRLAQALILLLEQMVEEIRD